MTDNATKISNRPKTMLTAKINFEKDDNSEIKEFVNLKNAGWYQNIKNRIYKNRFVSKESNLPSTWARSSGPILHAQPDPCENCVNFIFSFDNMLSI